MKIDSRVKEKADALLSSTQKNMGDALGIEFLVISRDEMRAVMPVSQNTVQPFGILHGGASVALAETLASVGAYMNIDDDTKSAMGLEINANHIKPVRLGGKVIGIAKPLHRGATTQVWETRIETESGKLVCISRCTLAIVSKRTSKK